jgi:hypothetical protein
LWGRNEKRPERGVFTGFLAEAVSAQNPSNAIQGKPELNLNILFYIIFLSKPIQERTTASKSSWHTEWHTKLTLRDHHGHSLRRQSTQPEA